MLKLKKQPLESSLESAEEETRDAPFDRLPDEVSSLLLPCCSSERPNFVFLPSC